MSVGFDERMTAAFYDEEDAKYRSFWDPAGSLHWGVFDEGVDDDVSFLSACERWNRCMLRAARIGADARVLDLGCGNGTTSLWLADQTGAEVVGVDLSEVRVGNARELGRRAGNPRLSFQQGSATELPFGPACFTHVFSQAVLYHTHDRARALGEVVRVLVPGGIFAFDDLVTPKRPVSGPARQYVYDRLLFEPTFSREEYIEALEHAGFVVYEAQDLSRHLARSYSALAQMAAPEHPELAEAYRHIPQIVAAGEVGWSFFLGQRVDDRLAWIYDTGDRRFSLEEKYDAWARSYDRDLTSTYAANPRAVADLAAAHLPRTARILDAGAGTGLVGQELKQRGFHTIAALDQSAGVLAEAARKGAYAEIVRGRLDEAAALFGPRSFDAITAAGVFTFGHAPVSDLEPLLEVLRARGLLVIAVRADYLETELEFGQVTSRLGLAEVARAEYRIFRDEPMVALVFRRRP